MTVLFSSQTSDFDGSGSPVTPTADIFLNINGTWGGAWFELYVSEGSGYAKVYDAERDSRVKVSLPATGSTWYAKLVNTSSTTSLNCAYVNA